MALVHKYLVKNKMFELLEYFSLDLENELTSDGIGIDQITLKHLPRKSSYISNWNVGNVK